MDENAIRLATTLAEVVGRNTIEWTGNKILQAKQKREMQEQQNCYEEIINNLLQDKMELERITQEYKALYEKVTISDDDIEYLQKTIKAAITLISAFSPNMKEQEDSINVLIGLLNKDTLKTMQLLGFNYKEAIGQPLTEACSTAIRNKLYVGSKQNPKQSKR